MNATRLMIVILVGVIAASQVLAAGCPDVAQVNATDMCQYYDGCSRQIQWRGSCGDCTREWRCSWGGSPTCALYNSPWQGACCSGSCCPAGTCGCDCLLAGSMITMADGELRAIEHVRVGDEVLAYDERTRQMRPSRVTRVHRPYSVDHYFVLNEKLRATEFHPVLSGGNWIAIGEVSVGAPLAAVSGHTEAKSLRRVDAQTLVYNFQVELATYVADGVIVHNKEDCETFTQYCPTCGN